VHRSASRGSLLPPRGCQAAGDDGEQEKNTEARQGKRAANQEGGDRAEQGKNTEARQRKRTGIRERAKTGIQPRASARLVLSIMKALMSIHGAC